jgi:hypothetical protein
LKERGQKIFNTKKIISTNPCYEARGIAENVIGLCVSLPLHKCLNYSRKLIGQIAQNPCYKQYGIIAQNSNRRTKPFSFLFLSDGKNNFEKIK